MTAAKIVLLCLAMGFMYSCSHVTPSQARKMPLIKVLHDGEIEKIALEKYVALVLAGEVHHSWPMEALKAQAIAARTYALLRMKERKNNDYHVQNSVMDQVLKKSTHNNFITAARETAGLVLSIGDVLAESSFHSTCGGHTTDSKSVWGRSYAHLPGSKCGFCQKSPSYDWAVEIPLADVENKFMQKINKIDIVNLSPDGRADLIELIGNKKQTIRGHEFRMTLGAMKVKSTLIRDLSIEGDKVKVKGNGFGHGVGMCQYGAMGMAKSGKNYKNILSHYYPGTSVKRIY